MGSKEAYAAIEKLYEITMDISAISGCVFSSELMSAQN